MIKALVGATVAGVLGLAAFSGLEGSPSAQAGTTTVVVITQKAPTTPTTLSYPLCTDAQLSPCGGNNYATYSPNLCPTGKQAITIGTVHCCATLNPSWHGSSLRSQRCVPGHWITPH